MAMGTEWSCPICRDASGNVAYVGSCLHQFCCGCIVSWARKNPSCLLWRQTVHTIIYPAPPDQDFVEMAVPQPSVPQSTDPREEPGTMGLQPQAHVAGFPPETWALFFCKHAEILQPLELWLNEVLCRACWWDVAIAHGRIVASLCCYGLYEEALAQELQPFLPEQMAIFLRQLIEVVADQCSKLAWRLMPPPAGQSRCYRLPWHQWGRSSAMRGRGRPGLAPRTPGRMAAVALGSPGSRAGTEAMAGRTLEQKKKEGSM